jgi:hypothetical protein
MIGDEPEYLGCSTVRGITDQARPEPLLDKGTLMALGPGSSIIVQQHPPAGVIRWSCTTHCPRGQLAGMEAAALRHWVAQRLHDWRPPVANPAVTTPPQKLRVKGSYDREPAPKTLSAAVIL